MPDPLDDAQILADAALLEAFEKSEYWPAFERVYEAILEDRKNAVLNLQVRSEGDIHLMLEAKGRYMGLLDIIGAMDGRIAQAARIRKYRDEVEKANADRQAAAYRR